MSPEVGCVVPYIDGVVSSMIFWSVEPNSAVSNNTTNPGAHTYVERTGLPANYTYLTDKLHTVSTLQMKPGQSPITSTATPETSFT